MLTEKEYLDLQGLQRYDELIKDYVEKSKVPTYDSTTETLIFFGDDSTSADSTNNQNN